MARKIDDGPISLPGFAGECLQGFEELLAAKVADTFDRVKSGSPQHRGKEFRVARRIRKCGYCGVSGIADDECDTASLGIIN
jgi:hypothetical protein